MRPSRKALWMSIVIFAFSLLGAGCSNLVLKDQIEKIEDGVAKEEESKPSKTEQDKEIKIAMRKPKTLNPILNMDKSVDQTLKLIFDSLVEFNEKDELVPNLAKSWHLDEEGKVLDITLDSNIKWHDGEPLKAADVLFSIKAIQDAEQSPYKASIRNIVSAIETEDHGVRITYQEPFSGYGYQLYFPIIPAHIEDLGDQPIGTGAYLYESSYSSSNMILKGNRNYFKGEPKIEKIEVLYTPDAESDLYSFDQGLIDVVNTDVIDWEKYSKNKKSNIFEYATLNYDYIGLNFNQLPLQDIKMRQALLYATNREYLLEKLYLYHGEVVDVPVSPMSWLYEPKSKKYDGDVDKAKELLAGKTQTLSLLVNKNNPQRKSVAEALKKMYKDIGIELELLEVDETEFIEKVQSRQYDLYLGGWDLSVIPDLSFAFHSSNAEIGTNYGNYTDEKMDQLLRVSLNAKSDEKLKDAYSKLQLYIGEQLPYLSLHFRTSALITNVKIKGDMRPHHMNCYQNIHEWYIN